MIQMNDDTQKNDRDKWWYKKIMIQIYNDTNEWWYWRMMIQTNGDTDQW